MGYQSHAGVQPGRSSVNTSPLGAIFGTRKIIREAKPDSRGNVRCMWECQKCRRRGTTFLRNLPTHGCRWCSQARAQPLAGAKRRLDYTGKVYGSKTVLGPATPTLESTKTGAKRRRSRVRWRCSCGNAGVSQVKHLQKIRSHCSKCHPRPPSQMHYDTGEKIGIRELTNAVGGLWLSKCTQCGRKYAAGTVGAMKKERRCSVCRAARSEIGQVYGSRLILKHVKKAEWRYRCLRCGEEGVQNLSRMRYALSKRCVACGPYANSVSTLTLHGVPLTRKQLCLTFGLSRSSVQRALQGSNPSRALQALIPTNYATFATRVTGPRKHPKR